MQLVKGLVALYHRLRNFLIVFAACKQLSCFSGKRIFPPSLSSPGCERRCAEGKRTNTGFLHLQAGGIGSRDFPQRGLSPIWLPGERRACWEDWPVWSCLLTSMRWQPPRSRLLYFWAGQGEEHPSRGKRDLLEERTRLG